MSKWQPIDLIRAPDRGSIRLPFVIIFGLLLGFLLANCAPQIRVQSITDRTAFISGSGSAFNSGSGVGQAMLQAAARHAIENGYEYFQIVDTQDTSYTAQWNVPGSAYTSCGGGSCYSTFSPATSIPLNVPSGNMAIRLYREGEIDPGEKGVYLAASVTLDDQ